MWVLNYKQKISCKQFRISFTLLYCPPQSSLVDRLLVTTKLLYIFILKIPLLIKTLGIAKLFWDRAHITR